MTAPFARRAGQGANGQEGHSVTVLANGLPDE